jgi:hypothetical protein
MRKIILLAILTCLITVVSSQAAPQSRLVLRASKDVIQFNSLQIGPAAWSVIPDLFAPKLKNAAVAGLRLHDSTRWYVDVMGGRLANGLAEEWMANVRSSLTVRWFQCYGEFQLYPHEKKFYWMAQAGYLFKAGQKPVVRLGLETENIHQNRVIPEIKIGPNVMIPLSEHLTIAGTWYFPNHGQHFFRTYTILNL